MRLTAFTALLAHRYEKRIRTPLAQVAGCNSLHASFRNFVSEERLCGDNQYNTRDPKYGRQVSRCGSSIHTIHAARRTIGRICRLHVPLTRLRSPSRATVAGRAARRALQEAAASTTAAVEAFRVRGCESRVGVIVGRQAT